MSKASGLALAQPLPSDLCEAFARHALPGVKFVNAFLREQLLGTRSSHEHSLTLPQRWVQWFSSPTTIVPRRVAQLDEFLASRNNNNSSNDQGRIAAAAAASAEKKKKKKQPLTAEVVGRTHEETTVVALKGSDGKVYAAVEREADVVAAGGDIAAKIVYQSTTMKQLPSVISIQQDLLNQMRALDAPA